MNGMCEFITPIGKPKGPIRFRIYMLLAFLVVLLAVLLALFPSSGAYGNAVLSHSDSTRAHSPHSLAVATATSTCIPYWAVISSPNIGTHDNYLLDIDAISSTDVWIVGYYYDGFASQTLVQHWNGTQWSVIPSPNAPVGNSILAGVAVLSATEVWAVGYTSTQTLVERWNGTSWSIVPSPNVGTGVNGLTGVLAFTSNDAWATGHYYQQATGKYQTLAMHWNGTSWSIVPTPNVGTDSNFLWGDIDGVASNDIWAAGSYGPGGSRRTLMLHWNGTSWSTVSTPNVGTAENRLQGVDAIAANDAWAVGWYGTYPNEQTLVQHWDGAGWSIVASPNASAGQNLLLDVSAVSASDVWAIGFHDAQTLAEHWDGAQWQIVPSPNAGAGSYPEAIAALSGNDVWAVGNYSSANVRRSFTLHYTSSPGNCATSTPTATPTSVCSPVQERYVLMVNFTYSPQTVTVTLGTRIRWLNEGPSTHTTTSDTGVWDSGVMNPGQTYGVLFNSPGTYPYHCTLHPETMTGTVNVLAYCTATATPNTTPSVTPTVTRTATPVRSATATRTSTVTPVCTPTSRSVLIVDSGYLPPDVTVTLGTTLSWFNEGPSVHTSTSDTGLWDSGNINPGFSYGYTFNSPGTYSYHCAIHPALVGTVNVLSGCSMTTTPTATAAGTSTYTPTRTATVGTTATGTAAAPSETVTSTQTQVATVPPSFTPVSTATAPPSVTVTPCTIQFSDVPEGNAFYVFIRCLACRSIVSGYDDGTFRPYNDITRAQIAKVISNAAGIEDEPGPQVFEDVESANPFYVWINRLANRGYMSGYSCGGEGEPCGPENWPWFRPFANATRGQLAKIVSNAADLGGDPTGVFYIDVQEDHPFYLWIMRLTNLGVMSGYPCGGEGEPCDPQNRPYFRPYNNVTRGQASKIVANTFFLDCQTPARR